MSKTVAKEIIEQKRKGLSDKEIGEIYGVNYKFIEQAVTKELGVNVSSLKPIRKKIKSLHPKNFQLEKNTVWSFKSRGSWATHNGNYRGNWSPYIPRNIILRYSNEGDTVLDYFCGGGTTAVECKLLNRNFIGIDINPNAIELTKQNINFDEADLFTSGKHSKLDLMVGDARDLSFIDSNSIDLICSHPPYADIINYTEENPSDLSHYPIEKFLIEIEKVANESYRVLKENHYCSILIGDMRKNKNVVTLGFQTIQRFLDAGFEIKELIIKRQHNCKTSGFWYKNSIKYNFLLLAHEYLVVFKKVHSKSSRKQNIFNKGFDVSQINVSSNIKLETTTVWIFNKDNWLNSTISNLVKRYSAGSYYVNQFPTISDITAKQDLIIGFYNEQFNNLIDFSLKYLKKDGYMAIIVEDVRLDNGLVFPSAIAAIKKLNSNNEFRLKEIVILSIENNKSDDKSDDNLNITHKYLLVFKRISK
jgi:DNA modification methylase